MDDDVTLSTIQRALGLSPEQAETVFLDWQRHMVEMRDDLTFLCQSPVEEINGYCKSHIEHDGVEHLRGAAARKKGVVFLSAHYACLYWMLFADLSFLNEIVITRLDHNEQSRKIVGNLEKIVPSRLSNVIADAHAMPRIYRALKKGNAVWATFDFYAQSGPFVIAELFGKDVAAPCALLSVAHKANALIVPAFCFASGPNRVIRTEKCIDPEDYKDASIGTFIYDVAAHLHQLIDEQTRRDPEQWQLWDNLQARWDFAEALLGSSTELDTYHAA